MKQMGVKTQNQRLDAQRALIVRDGKELAEQMLLLRQQMRAYRDKRHAQCDPLGLPVVLEDDPNWQWWMDMIADCESAIIDLRADYKRITALMES